MKLYVFPIVRESSDILCLWMFPIRALLSLAVLMPNVLKLTLPCSFLICASVVHYTQPCATQIVLLDKLPVQKVC